MRQAKQAENNAKLSDYQNNLTNEHDKQQQAISNAVATQAGDHAMGMVEVNIVRSYQDYNDSLGDVQINKMQARAEATVEAAAAGTTGGSVSDMLLDMDRSAARAEGGLMRKLQNDVNDLELSRADIANQTKSRIRNDRFLPFNTRTTSSKDAALSGLIDFGTSNSGMFGSDMFGGGNALPIRGSGRGS